MQGVCRCCAWGVQVLCRVYAGAVLGCAGTVLRVCRCCAAHRGDRQTASPFIVREWRFVRLLHMKVQSIGWLALKVA